MVDGEEFSSTFCHRRVKDAEQDAAKVAYDTLLERKETETDDTDVFELIDQVPYLNYSLSWFFTIFHIISSNVYIFALNYATSC